MSSEDSKSIKTVDGWGFAYDPTRGAYSAPSDHLAGGKGFPVPSAKSHARSQLVGPSGLATRGP